MAEWWSNLTVINQVFYCAAAFFGVIFVWQLVMTLIGLGGGEDVGGDADSDFDADVDADTTYDHFEHGAEADAVETMAAFRLLTLRSILAFFTLFTWGGALYLNTGTQLGSSMIYALLWGGAAMVLVALMFHWMRKMTESGNISIRTCVGTEGQVYLDIPSDGIGQIRATVSGVVTYVKARTADGNEIKSGAPVLIRRAVNPTTVEVEAVVRQPKERKE